MKFDIISHLNNVGKLIKEIHVYKFVAKLKGELYRYYSD